MPNLNAALGCAQMEKLPELLQRKRSLAMQYQEVFRDVKGFKLFGNFYP
nr:DegT/DnrJ/EryC1/StrS family aminotransferase [Cylindrospermopsis raciborskii]